MLTPQQAPPDNYYQNNCVAVFEFVLQHYARLLDTRALRQLQRYLALSDDAQRLFARLLTRKGPLLRVDSLNYDEITDTESAITELANESFIHYRAPAPADRLLALLKKAELVAFSESGLRSSLSKQEMLSYLLHNNSDEQIRRRLTGYMDWINLADPQLWWLLRLLYFGDAVQDWSAFVIRDLGMVQYENVPMHAQRFNDAQVLQQDLAVRRLSALSRRIDEHPGLAQDLLGLLQACEETITDRFIRSRRQRTLMRVGRWHERQAQTELAVQAYQGVGAHPARERIVRVLHKAGDEQAAARWLQRIRRAPLGDEEAQFAERFGRRRAGFQPQTTELRISQASQDIEQQALALLLEDAHADAWGAHVENALVRTLTGLVYWEAIFADIPGAFTNPFQFGPNDLYREDFAELRAQHLLEIEDRLAADEALHTHLLRMAEHKKGVANSLVNWRMLESIPLERFLAAMPIEDVRRLTGFMIRNLGQRRSGLPDLFIAHGAGEYEFVEVKGPGDQLQPGQRVWFQHFQRLGIPARVLKLRLTA